VAAGIIVTSMVTSVLWLETTTFPVLDRNVSARGLWRRVAARPTQVCVGEVNRGWRYNLNYYSDSPLPGCREAPRPIRIEPGPGGVPHLDFADFSAF
jgi:hypothetical protein